MTIQELLQQLGVEYCEAGGHHHSREGWIQLQDCPFCNSNRYHLGFNLSGKYFFCWRCQKHSAWSVLDRLGVQRHQIKEFLGALDADQSPKVERVQGRLEEPKHRGPLLRAHRDYLRGRKLDPEKLVEMWQIEGIGITSGRLSWRIYIPVLFKEKRVSWTTRAVGDKVTQRYLSAPAAKETINHKKVLYGFDYCTQSAVAVEGPVDVWKIGPGACGLFGTAYLPAQVLLLSAFPYRYVCFDSSKEAQLQAQRLCSELAVFPGQTHNIVLDAKDPGEASPSELRKLRKFCKL